MRLMEVAAVSLDLDDTLWPFASAVARAESVLYSWLIQRAPATAAVLDGPETLQKLRIDIGRERPDLSGDFRALRLESIRGVLLSAGENPLLAETAYEVFFAQRQRVELFNDVVPALERLSRRYPIIALTNGNSDPRAAGIQSFFRATIAAPTCGYAKPDPKIFLLAADFLGVAAGQLLHVGDDPLLDVDGALSAGLQAAWLRRSALLDTATQRKPNSMPELIVGDLKELAEILCPDCSGSGKPQKIEC